MKKEYTKVEINVINFENEDVITTSGGVNDSLNNDNLTGKN